MVAAVVGLTEQPDTQLSAALWLALVLTVAHSLTTARVAPLNFSQRAAAGDPARLEAIFDQFERWSRARSVLQVMTLLSAAWALVAKHRRRLNPPPPPPLPNDRLNDHGRLRRQVA